MQTAGPKHPSDFSSEPQADALRRSLRCTLVTERVSPSVGGFITYSIIKHIHPQFYLANVVMTFNTLKLHARIENTMNIYEE